jgi:hypothetical protein
MGTTCIGEKPRDVKAYMDGLYTWENESGKRTVLRSAIVNLREYYAAVEFIKPDGTRTVWAGVAKLSFYRNDFCYKNMDETVGPLEQRCPVAILDMLTPTDHQWSNEWRAKCRAYHAARRAKPALKDGARIKIEDPPIWRGVTLSEVTVRRVGRRTRFYHPSLGTFGWPSIRQYNYTAF